MPRSLISHLAAAVLVVGCSDPNEPDHTGSMSFDYHGSLADAPSGSFDVVGSRKPFEDTYPTGAGGFSNTEGTVTILEITGSRHEGQQEFEMLFSGPPAIGVVPMCEAATPSTTMCVLSGYWLTGMTSIYHFGSPALETPGTTMHVTITALTDRRISGTFEGTAVGTCGTCALTTAADTVSFTNGRFDVPYR